MLYIVLIILAGIGLATVVKKIYAEGVKVGMQSEVESKPDDEDTETT